MTALLPADDASLGPSKRKDSNFKSQQRPDHAEAPLTPSPKSAMLPVSKASVVKKPLQRDIEKVHIGEVQEGRSRARAHLLAKRSLHTRQPLTRWSSMTAPQLAVPSSNGQQSRTAAGKAKLIRKVPHTRKLTDASEQPCKKRIKASSRGPESCATASAASAAAQIESGSSTEQPRPSPLDTGEHRPQA